MFYIINVLRCLVAIMVLAGNAHCVWVLTISPPPEDPAADVVTNESYKANGRVLWDTDPGWAYTEGHCYEDAAFKSHSIKVYAKTARVIRKWVHVPSGPLAAKGVFLYGARAEWDMWINIKNGEAAAVNTCFADLECRVNGNTIWTLVAGGTQENATTTTALGALRIGIPFKGLALALTLPKFTYTSGEGRVRDNDSRVKLDDICAESVWYKQRADAALLLSADGTFPDFDAFVETQANVVVFWTRFELKEGPTCH